MEKLIELLNEWKGKSYIFYMPDGADKVHRKETDAYGNMHVSCIKNCELISKEFGFIKWLVDNDKIETNNLSLKAFKNIFSGGGFVEVSDLEVLLMLLAISDTPIEDLISFLK